MDNTIIVPYEAMDESAIEEMCGNFARDIMYSNKIPIYFSSNTDGVIEEDMETMRKYITDNGWYILQDVDGFTEEEIDSEKYDTIPLYRVVKQIVCIISAVFCFIAVFEVIRLFLNRKKKDITILWALGSKKKVVYGMLIKELGMAILVGAVLAFLCEWIIYGLILQCRLATVFLYGTYSLILVLLIAFIMIVAITDILLRKCKISEEKA